MTIYAGYLGIARLGGNTYRINEANVAAVQEVNATDVIMGDYFHDAWNYGTAAVGGTIGLVKDGDIIEIDVPKRVLRVKLSDEELKNRAKTWTAKEPNVKTGYLARYSQMVQSAHKGSVLKKSI